MSPSRVVVVLAVLLASWVSPSNSQRVLCDEEMLKMAQITVLNLAPTAQANTSLHFEVVFKADLEALEKKGLKVDDMMVSWHSTEPFWSMLHGKHVQYPRTTLMTAGARPSDTNMTTTTVKMDPFIGPNIYGGFQAQAFISLFRGDKWLQCAFPDSLLPKDVVVTNPATVDMMGPIIMQAHVQPSQVHVNDTLYLRVLASDASGVQLSQEPCMFVGMEEETEMSSFGRWGVWEREGVSDWYRLPVHVAPRRVGAIVPGKYVLSVLTIRDIFDNPALITMGPGGLLNKDLLPFLSVQVLPEPQPEPTPSRTFLF
eukprot:GILK01007295.1.p1 GENE.GILK01007295.1~~GILK01007295.1.p1  ORF type:complete len:331 (+),score=48.86 GILK01007295.1:55-993(+)